MVSNTSPTPQHIQRLITLVTHVYDRDGRLKLFLPNYWRSELAETALQPRISQRLQADHFTEPELTSTSPTSLMASARLVASPESSSQEIAVCVALLRHLPFVVQFMTRVGVFRNFVLSYQADVSGQLGATIV